MKKKFLVLIGYAFAGWVLCATTIGIGMAVTSLETALIIHAVAAPCFFAIISFFYFSKNRYLSS